MNEVFAQQFDSVISLKRSSHEDKDPCLVAIFIHSSSVHVDKENRDMPIRTSLVLGRDFASINQNATSIWLP